MPILIALGLIVAAFVFAIVMMPFALVVRYRAGTRRRRARAWIATVSVVSLLLSAASFLVSAAIVGRWVPDAFAWSSRGLGGGALLGIFGLVVTRWERDGAALYYTPSRLLALMLSVVVAARIAYGLWRGWQTWQSSPDTTSWVAAIGIAGSMAAGALLLGYYLAYAIGVRVRATRT